MYYFYILIAAHKNPKGNLWPYPELNKEDFGWALSRMDGVIDVSREDLVDLYEFAVEHVQQHRATMHTGEKPQ